jgi:hypothetical protein
MRTLRMMGVLVVECYASVYSSFSKLVLPFYSFLCSFVLMGISNFYNAL